MLLASHCLKAPLTLGPIWLPAPHEEVQTFSHTVYDETMHNITEAQMRIGTAKTDLTKLWSLQPRSSQARALKADVMSLKEFWHVIHQNYRRANCILYLKELYKFISSIWSKKQLKEIPLRALKGEKCI